jgi:hypothetical protein
MSIVLQAPTRLPLKGEEKNHATRPSSCAGGEMELRHACL